MSNPSDYAIRSTDTVAPEIDRSHSKTHGTLIDRRNTLCRIRRRRIPLKVTIPIFFASMVFSWVSMKRIEDHRRDTQWGASRHNERKWDWLIGYLDQFGLPDHYHLNDLVSFCAASLSVLLSFCSGWPYYLAYRGLIKIESVPLKFSAMSIVNGAIALYCGIWLNNLVVTVSGGFNLMWTVLCLVLREFAVVKHEGQPFHAVAARLFLLIASIFTMFVILGIMPERLTELVWIIVQILPSVALLIDYRKAFKQHNIDGISLPMLSVCLLCNFSWLMYGINEKSIAIITPSLMGILLPGFGVAAYYAMMTGNFYEAIQFIFLTN